MRFSIRRYGPACKGEARLGVALGADRRDEVVRRLGIPGSSFKDVADLVRGDKGRVVLESGDIEAGIFWAGQVQGLIHDIPTVRELVDRIMSEARAIIHGRLSGLVDPSAIAA